MRMVQKKLKAVVKEEAFPWDYLADNRGYGETSNCL
jgi:hypothetical protein